ncbi:MAG: hypothetical protein QXT45_06755 [Candidatus Bilamarchaeaceae archaeon]
MTPILLALMLPTGAWQMIGIGLGIAIVVAALFQLIAALFQSPQIKAIANEEIAALFFTMIIIWFWVTAEASLNFLAIAITSMYTGPTGSAELQGLTTAHLDMAIMKTEAFRTQLLSMYIRLVTIDVLVGFMSTLSFNLGTLPGGVGIFSLHIAPYVPLALISDALARVLDGIGLLAMTMWAKKMILFFSKVAIPLIFLPLGIICRAIPFSRSTGSSIIALSFALYFVFPLTILFSYYMIFDIYALKMDYHYAKFTTPFRTEISNNDINQMVSDMKQGDATIRAQHEESMSETSSKAAEEACCGPDANCGLIRKVIRKLLCGVDKIVNKVNEAGVPVIGTIWETFKEMLRYSGGIFDMLFSEGSILLPSGMLSGLYLTLIRVVSKTAEIFVIILLATILEIMITVTMYRNISLLIGGEPEIAGITKII